eukprot:TRINITY_DN37634_c0_g1_i1.p1 TRINITY_DN37634_c0_g1~~TRINITY_DN37634_c0_g1_i1.p1  ORF type:complete len:807 (+),score=195.71 TRINITY_DN37634_c0_g1_i1:96-2516(+)
MATAQARAGLELWRLDCPRLTLWKALSAPSPEAPVARHFRSGDTVEAAEDPPGWLRLESGWTQMVAPGTPFAWRPLPPDAEQRTRDWAHQVSAAPPRAVIPPSLGVTFNGANLALWAQRRSRSGKMKACVIAVTNQFVTLCDKNGGVIRCAPASAVEEVLVAADELHPPELPSDAPAARTADPKAVQVLLAIRDLEDIELWFATEERRNHPIDDPAAELGIQIARSRHVTLGLRTRVRCAPPPLRAQRQPRTGGDLRLGAPDSPRGAPGSPVAWRCEACKYGNSEQRLTCNLCSRPRPQLAPPSGAGSAASTPHSPPPERFAPRPGPADRPVSRSELDERAPSPLPPPGCPARRCVIRHRATLKEVRYRPRRGGDLALTPDPGDVFLLEYSDLAADADVGAQPTERPCTLRHEATGAWVTPREVVDGSGLAAWGLTLSSADSGAVWLPSDAGALWEITCDPPAAVGPHLGPLEATGCIPLVLRATPAECPVRDAAELLFDFVPAPWDPPAGAQPAAPRDVLAPSAELSELRGLRDEVLELRRAMAAMEKVAKESARRGEREQQSRLEEGLLEVLRGMVDLQRQQSGTAAPPPRPSLYRLPSRAGEDIVRRRAERAALADADPRHSDPGADPRRVDAPQMEDLCAAEKQLALLRRVQAIISSPAPAAAPGAATDSSAARDRAQAWPEPANSDRPPRGGAAWDASPPAAADWASDACRAHRARHASCPPPPGRGTLRRPAAVSSGSPEPPPYAARQVAAVLAPRPLGLRGGQLRWAGTPAAAASPSNCGGSPLSSATGGAPRHPSPAG